MITHLHLKSGSSAGQPPLTVETPPSVTIFVGPNNSGKTQTLREIIAVCNSGSAGASLVVDKLAFEAVDQATAEREFDSIVTAPNVGERVPAGYSVLQVGSNRMYVERNTYVRTRLLPNENPSVFAGWCVRHLTLNLDGTSRMGLVQAQERGSLKNPTNPLARLLVNDPKRGALRKVLYDAFGLYFAIDAQDGNQLLIRFGSTPPPDERRFHDAAIEYMRAAFSIDSVSDGVKAYTGVLLQLYAGNPKIIVIDEPEAFLHPSLAFKLGGELAKAARTEGKHVFAATHSPQFVMGAILSGAKINIIRLTYEAGAGTARLLPSAELGKLMRDPLLRSANVLAGLFYNSVVVCEADADRAFYQEVNQRLLDADDQRGTPHALFLNADNKQTVPRIVEPLRKLGVPCAAIVDLDVLKDGGDEWARHLRACSVSYLEHGSYALRRKKVLDALEARSTTFKTSGGICVLSGEERAAAENLLGDLARHGFFIVDRGEIEDWLPELRVPRSKHVWLRSIFEKMGDDASSPEYVKPSPEDVWDFLGRVHAWLTDPAHHGIPK